MHGNNYVELLKYENSPRFPNRPPHKIKNMTSSAPTIVVNNDEICCFCRDEAVHLNTYYRPPCGHLYCYSCMDHPLLNRCMRCNAEFVVAEPVRTYRQEHVVEIVEDEVEQMEDAQQEDVVTMDDDGTVYFNGVVVVDVRDVIEIE